MINIKREESWEVGDTLLSGNHIYMICCNNGYFFIDLEGGYGFKPCDSLEELVTNYIQPKDIKIDLECKVSIGTFKTKKPLEASK